MKFGHRISKLEKSVDPGGYCTCKKVTPQLLIQDFTSDSTNVEGVDISIPVCELCQKEKRTSIIRLVDAS